MLATNGVPLDAIRELLGHSDLQTTLGYIYNPLTDTEIADLIEKALQTSMSSTVVNARDGAHEVRGTSVLRGPERSEDSEPMHVCMGS